MLDAGCGLDLGMTAADLACWHQIADPDSPDFILNQPDYYCVTSPIIALVRSLT